MGKIFDIENKTNKAYFISILAYSVLFVATYYLLHAFGVLSLLPNQENLIRWDAGFYNSIKNEGYIFKENTGCNSGFFPLFAYFWKLTSLSPVGISILNYVIYATSLFFLSKLLKPDTVLLGIFMSFPFMFFMATPLSESLFFLFSTIILYGLHRNDNRLVFVGIFFASLTRASYLFFVPAFLGIVLMLQPFRDAYKVNKWAGKLKWYLAPILTAFIVFGLIQYLQVGKFFAYFEIQSSVWGRKFGLPVFPLGRNSKPWIVKLTWFNFWLGLFISYIGLKYLINWIKGNTLNNIKKYELFSIIYLVMSFLSIIFFNPEWFWYHGGNYNGTYLTGINRYLQANPFIFVFMVYIFKKAEITKYHIVLLIITSYLIWFAVVPRYYGSFYDLKSVSTVTLILLSYWLYYHLRWKSIAIAIILFSLYQQCIMFNYFINTVQVD